MAIQTSKYEANSGDVHPIRVDSSVIISANPVPSGSVTSDVFAKVSATKREFALRPRQVSLGRTVGTAPNTGRRYRRLPILTESAFNAITKGQSLTVGSISWEVLGKSPEDT